MVLRYTIPQCFKMKQENINLHMLVVFQVLRNGNRNVLEYLEFLFSFFLV